MTKYKYVLTFPDGKTVDSSDYDEIFDTYEDAYDAGQYATSCWDLGGEILNLNNPGDYDYDPDEYMEIEVDVEEIEV